MKKPRYQELKPEETIEKRFARTIVSVRDWVIANRVSVVVVTAGVVIAVALVIHFSWQRDKHHTHVQEVLSTAVNAPGTDPQKLAEILEETAGSSAELWARGLYASALLEQGGPANNRKAAAEYAKLAQASDNALVRILAALNQAIALENAGEVTEARAIYKRIKEEAAGTFPGERAATLLEKLAGRRDGTSAVPATMPAAPVLPGEAVESPRAQQDAAPEPKPQADEEPVKEAPAKTPAPAE